MYDSMLLLVVFPSRADRVLAVTPANLSNYEACGVPTRLTFYARADLVICITGSWTSGVES